MEVVAVHTDWTRLLFLRNLLLEFPLCLPVFARIEAMIAEGANPYPYFLGAVVLHAIDAKHSLDAIEGNTSFIRLTASGGLPSCPIVVPNNISC